MRIHSYRQAIRRWASFVLTAVPLFITLVFFQNCAEQGQLVIASAEPTDDSASSSFLSYKGMLSALDIDLSRSSVETQSHFAPGNPIASVDAVNGNGHALSWDGRIGIFTRGMTLSPRANGALVMHIRPDQLNLVAGQSFTQNGYTLAMYDNGVLAFGLTKNTEAIFKTENALWHTPVGLCQGACRARHDNQGNLVLLSPTGAKYWQTGTRLNGALQFYSQAPFAAVRDSNNQVAWSSGKTLQAPGWQIRIFRPEVLTETALTDPKVLGSKINSSFSGPYKWAVPNTVPDEFIGDVIKLPIASLNSIAIYPAPEFKENPYRSDDKGNAVANGAFMTYKMVIVSQNQDPQSWVLGMMKTTMILANPHSKDVRIHSTKIDKNYQQLVDTNGQPLRGLEPTATFDGRLIIYQRFDGVAGEHGSIYYSYNSSAGTESGFSAPKRITEIHNDEQLRLRYPLARYPVRDGRGNPYTGAVFGAYPWVNLDGSDVFFSAARHKDNATRAGTAILGVSSKGLVRHLDGGINNARVGGLSRLFMSSLGRTPGMWSPLEFMDKKVLPITDKTFTYPMFFSNSARYAEYSFEETVTGSYEFYLEMAEALTQRNLTYDLEIVPDVSGNFHYAIKNEGALFAEEAFPTVCTSLDCPMNDSQSATAKLFSGKAMYFKDSGALNVMNRSAQGRELLKDAKNLTVSLAVRPMKDLTKDPTKNEYRFLIHRHNSFHIVLEENRFIHATVNLRRKDGSLVSYRSGFVGPALPLDEWSHVAMLFETETGTMQVYINGSLALSRVFEPGLKLNTDANTTIIGHNAAGYNEIVFALDQVGVSNVLRTPQELLRQAQRVTPRNLQIKNALPLGLKSKDVGSVALKNRPLDSNKIELGRHLFFDRRLSSGNTSSCASCHLPNNNFAGNVDLHANRLVRFDGVAKILRNTPSVVNLGMKSGGFFWDGRSPSMASQAVAVLTNPHEMGHSMDEVVAKLSASAQYTDLVNKAYPGQKVSAEKVAESLEEFQLSLLNGNSKVDRYVAGDLLALNEFERRGKALFYGKARCAECHSGSNFSNSAYHNLSFLAEKNSVGTTDRGRFDFTSSADDLFKFATPSLRNVEQTAPYFHNGSAANLEETIARYISFSSRGNSGRLDDSLQTIDLEGNDIADLAAFMRALTGQTRAVSSPNYTDLPPRMPNTLDLAAGQGNLNAKASLEMNNLKLTLGADGNLVLIGPYGQSLWQSNTRQECSSTPCRMSFQSDGNLVLYRGNQAYWSTGTGSGVLKGSVLKLSEYSPQMSIVNAAGSVVWANTYSFKKYKIEQGKFLRFGNVPHILTMQSDGNLVVYKVDGSKLEAKWATNTAKKVACNPCSASMQSDGNLVLYSGTSPFWATNTGGNFGSTLVLSEAPYISIVSPTKGAIYQSR